MLTESVVKRLVDFNFTGIRNYPRVVPQQILTLKFDAIVDYLAKTYPGEDVPKIKVNEARAIELESGLSLPRSQAAAIIQYRDKNASSRSLFEHSKLLASHLSHRRVRIINQPK